MIDVQIKKGVSIEFKDFLFLKVRDVIIWPARNSFLFRKAQSGANNLRTIGWHVMKLRDYST